MPKNSKFLQFQFHLYDDSTGDLFDFRLIVYLVFNLIFNLIFTERKPPANLVDPLEGAVEVLREVEREHVGRGEAAEEDGGLDGDGARWVYLGCKKGCGLNLNFKLFGFRLGNFEPLIWSPVYGCAR